MTTVTFWHNIATALNGMQIACLEGYTDGHPLVPVFRYETGSAGADQVPVTDAREATRFAEDAFWAVHFGDDPARNDGIEQDLRDLAAQYAAQGNRGLTNGDVVQVDDTWLARTTFGWDTVPEPEWVCRQAATRGTHPLP